MNTFRTILPTQPSTAQIDLKSNILTVGSCFADTLGMRLKKYKSSVCVNPFGVVFHPLAIHQLLEHAITKKSYEKHTYTQRDGVFYNYFMHSQHADVSHDVLTTKLDRLTQDVHNLLANGDWLFITYGTAYGYTLKETSTIVANCHKQPSQWFEKSLTSVSDIVDSFNTLYEKLKQLNPALKIVLTVSPVRHLKDTLPLNAVSKSTLRLATHLLQETYTDVFYFPAYELLLDDLRDYRFFKEDLIHPALLAEEYIWEHFISTYGSNDFQNFVSKWKSVLNALAHKPFHPETNGHQEFLKSLLSKLEGFQTLVDVSDEINQVKQQII
jgi:hypothetical protein